MSEQQSTEHSSYVEASLNEQSLIGCMPTTSATNTQRLSCSEPYQPRSFNFPKRQIGDRLRSFIPTWFDTYPWLNYAPESTQDGSQGDSVTCFVCEQAMAKKLFLPSQRVEVSFAKAGFSNWKNAPNDLRSMKSLRSMLLPLRF